MAWLRAKYYCLFTKHRWQTVDAEILDRTNVCPYKTHQNVKSSTVLYRELFTVSFLNKCTLFLLLVLSFIKTKTKKKLVI